MHIYKKQIRYFFVICFVFLFTYFLGDSSNVKESIAQTTCPSSTVNVIIRDAQGNFIPNINFQIYSQGTDVDGRPKPIQLVSGGSINPTLGNAEVSFINNASTYALKIWDKNAEVGEFWFYDAINICGDSIEITEVLSDINIVFRDSENNLIKNVAYNLYTQKYDVDGDPIKERKDLVAMLNTGEFGQSVIYVADGTRGMDGDEGDYYMIEAINPNGGIYEIYDIRVSDAYSKNIEYVFSDMELTVEDSNGIPFPANTRIEVFKQEKDVDGNNSVGLKVKDVLTDDYGKAIFEYPKDTYVAKILGANNQYQYFWDLRMDDENRNYYTLTTDSDWDPGVGSCEAQSTLTFITRDLLSNPISGIHYELYTQDTDVDGNPKLETKIAGGQVNELGQSQFVFNPDPRKKYAVKIFDKNAGVGDFVYYNEVQFSCGSSKTFEKKLPVFRVVLRDGQNNLLKNHTFSVFTQKFDVDGKPIKEIKDLVATINTGETGEAKMYIAPNNMFDSTKNGTYVFNTRGENNVEYNEYDIVMKSDEDYEFEYTISDVIFELKNGKENILDNTTINLFERDRNLQGEYILGRLLKSVNTDENGEARFQFPSGYYVATVKDSLGQENPFWYVKILNRQSTRKSIVTNSIKIGIHDVKGNLKPEFTQFTVKQLKEEKEGVYVVDKLLATLSIGLNGYFEGSFMPGPYLISYHDGENEYGKAIYTENGKLQELIINNKDKIDIDQKYYLTKPTGTTELADKLKGYILLQVEELGEAWYVDPTTRERYYMKDGEVAYEMLRKFGLGITTSDLSKIPIGIEKRFEEMDYDGDYVFDKMEEALGTDMYLHDTDGDSFDDGTEVLNDFSPTGDGKLPVDKAFASKLKGKILLQVESRGEAWYVNPEDGRRYYMPDGEAAYQIMRYLSLGITNENLEKIDEGYMQVEE